MLLSELRGKLRAEKNTVVWMPLGGQINTLKGEQTERKRWQKLFFGTGTLKWGLGKGSSGMQICHSRCMLKEMVNSVVGV